MNPDVFREIPLPHLLQPYFRRILVGHVTESMQMDVTVRATGYCYLGWIARGRWAGYVNDQLQFDSKSDGRLMLSGQIDESAVNARFEGPLWQIFAEFSALGQYMFLGVPGIETLERAVGPQSINSERYKWIADRLSKVPENAPVEELQHQFIQALEASPDIQTSVPDYLHKAIKQIELCNGFCRIGEMADMVGTSERQFRREFINAVGLKPKTFCNVLQVNTALAVLMNKEESNLAELATECGFTDQSHLTRAFQKFLGTSPMSIASNAEATLARFVGNCRTSDSAS